MEEASERKNIKINEGRHSSERRREGGEGRRREEREGGEDRGMTRSGGRGWQKGRGRKDADGKRGVSR